MAHRFCVAQIPYKLKAVSTFRAQHLLRPATVVSDGLACFTAAANAGVHEAVVTGGAGQRAGQSGWGASRPQSSG
jgi:hypothetical protein